MPDTTSTILLKATAKGWSVFLESDPKAKAIATFITEVMSQFHDLPEDQQTALRCASADDLREAFDLKLGLTTEHAATSA